MALNTTKSNILRIILILTIFFMSIGLFGFSIYIRNSHHEPPELPAIRYNNEYYLIVNNEESLNSLSLPTIITPDMVGEYLGEDEDNYPYVSSRTKLYEYRNLNVSNIIIVENYRYGDSGEYYFAIMQ